MPACAAQSGGCTSQQMDAYTAASFGRVWPFFAAQYPNLASKQPKLVYIPAGAESDTDCKKQVAVIFSVTDKAGPKQFNICGSKLYVGEYDAYQAGQIVPSLEVATQLTGFVMDRVKALGKSTDYALVGPMNEMAKCVTGVWFQGAVKQHLPGATNQAVAAYLTYGYADPAPKALAKYIPTKAVAAEALAFGRKHTVADCNQRYLPKYPLSSAK
jgi:hypothetical protein